MGAQLGAHAQPVVPTLRVAAAPAAAESVREVTSLSERESSFPTEEESPAVWPDESAESSFLAEARSRGEAVSAPKPVEENVDEAETKPLPPLNELVDRIPAEVRDALEDLFRARFVRVKRMPKSAFKS